MLLWELLHSLCETTVSVWHWSLKSPGQVVRRENGSGVGEAGQTKTCEAELKPKRMDWNPCLSLYPSRCLSR